MDCWSCGYHYGSSVGYNDPAWNTYREALMGADLIACWFCGQYFNSDYDCCPYCGSYPGGGNFYGEIMSNQYNELMQGATLITCWSCGQWFNNDYDACPHCGMAPDDGYPDYGTFDGFTAGGNARFTYYNPDGSEYSTVICPYCGYEHSMATNCPNCGGGYT